MQTLEQCYSEISTDQTRWSYYENYKSLNRLAWHCKKVAYEFIQDFFAFAGKSKVFDDMYLSRNESYIKDRAPHIVSTFLLGIKLSECFGLDIHTRNDHNMDFKYYWFLACLYHDIGYSYEKKDIEHWKHLINSNGLDAVKEFANVDFMPDQIFRTYTRETVEFYFRCRANQLEKEPVIDHGIIGGILLYDKLRKQFDESFEHRINRAHTEDSFFIRQGRSRRLHSSRQHFEDYARAADAIIAHNIWRDTLVEYSKKYFNINPFLEVDPNCRIGLDNELCFLLSMSDSLEPIKKSYGLFLDIEIENIPGVKGVKLLTDEQLFQRYWSEIKKLEDWMVIDVQKDGFIGTKRVVTITAN